MNDSQLNDSAEPRLESKLENNRRAIPKKKRLEPKTVMLFLGLAALFAVTIVIAGVHIGAVGEDKWYTSFAAWLANLF